MKDLSVIRFDLEKRETERREDVVAEEEPLHVLLGSHHIATILCSPAKRRELALGHLLSEGLVKSIDEVDKISVERQECKVTLKRGIDAEKRIKLTQPFARVIFTSCGSADYWPFSKLIDRLKIPRVKSELKVDGKTVLESTRQLNVIASKFRRTGGVHVAALWRPDGKRVALAEDVGRHNAVDKVIGSAALQKVDLSSTFLSTSGRLTGDIVLKAVRVSIPIIASITAPLSSGVEIAKKTGLTLVGFVRGRRMNIYTSPERIIV